MDLISYIDDVSYFAFWKSYDIVWHWAKERNISHALAESKVNRFFQGKAGNNLYRTTQLMILAAARNIISLVNKLSIYKYILLLYYLEIQSVWI